VLKAHGTPKTPADLVGKPMIATVFPNRALMLWEFEKKGRVVKIVPDGPLGVADPELQVDAAIAGLGFLATFEGYTRRAVAEGRLVSLLEDWLPPFSGPFLYYPSRRQPPPALRAFIDFVREWRAKQEKGKRRLGRATSRSAAAPCVLRDAPFGRSSA
jgi:DNA-binding transcriptional LysR family regulator